MKKRGLIPSARQLNLRGLIPKAARKRGLIPAGKKKGGFSNPPIFLLVFPNHHVNLTQFIYPIVIAPTGDILFQSRHIVQQELPCLFFSQEFAVKCSPEPRSVYNSHSCTFSLPISPFLGAALTPPRLFHPLFLIPSFAIIGYEPIACCFIPYNAQPLFMRFITPFARYTANPVSAPFHCCSVQHLTRHAVFAPVTPPFPFNIFSHMYLFLGRRLTAPVIAYF